MSCFVLTFELYIKHVFAYLFCIAFELCVSVFNVYLCFTYLPVSLFSDSLQTMLSLQLLGVLCLFSYQPIFLHLFR